MASGTVRVNRWESWVPQRRFAIGMALELVAAPQVTKLGFPARLDKSAPRPCLWPCMPAGDLQLSLVVSIAGRLLACIRAGMKALMIVGAIVGFLIGLGFGLAGNSPWPAALWRACAAALGAALLTRWWGDVWLRGLRESLERRQSQYAPPAESAKALQKQ